MVAPNAKYVVLWNHYFCTFKTLKDVREWARIYDARPHEYVVFERKKK